MRKYIDIIKDALNSVGNEYYLIPTTYNPEGIVRERVFCYELYHQIRKIQEEKNDEFPLYLSAEIDKSGHVQFLSEHRINPDFIIHKPGNMELNTIIVEVKGIIRSDDGIKKDLTNISVFIEKYNYKQGIFILYNHNKKEFKDYFIERFDEVNKVSNPEKILLIFKENINKNCDEVILSELLNGD